LQFGEDGIVHLTRFEQNRQNAQTAPLFGNQQIGQFNGRYEIGGQKIRAEKQNRDIRLIERLLDFRTPEIPGLDARVIPQINQARSLQRFHVNLQTVKPLAIAMTVTDEYPADDKPPAHRANCRQGAISPMNAIVSRSEAAFSPTGNPRNPVERCRVLERGVYSRLHGSP
jgi:hypothetical protein